MPRRSITNDDENKEQGAVLNENGARKKTVDDMSVFCNQLAPGDNMAGVPYVGRMSSTDE